MHPAEHSADAAYKRSLDMLQDDDNFWDEENPDDDKDQEDHQ